MSKTSMESTCKRSISASRFSEVNVVTAVTAAAPTPLPSSSSSTLPARHCRCLRLRGAAGAALIVRNGCAVCRCRLLRIQNNKHLQH